VEQLPLDVIVNGLQYIERGVTRFTASKKVGVGVANEYANSEPIVSK
jgi:hypothetical protein